LDGATTASDIRIWALALPTPSVQWHCLALAHVAHDPMIPHPGMHLEHTCVQGGLGLLVDPIRRQDRPLLDAAATADLAAGQVAGIFSAQFSVQGERTKLARINGETGGGRLRLRRRRHHVQRPPARSRPQLSSLAVNLRSISDRFVIQASSSACPVSESTGGTKQTVVTCVYSYPSLQAWLDHWRTISGSDATQLN